MSAATHATTLTPDGRTLAWCEYGDPTAPPVFLFHGTPGSRLDRDPFDRPSAARIIVPDRPGYGYSTHQPGRRLTDWPADVLAIADALGLDTFGVVGISGGGPHALVCAAMLPADRLTKVGTICGLGPNDWPGVTEGMQPMNVMFNELAITDPDQVLAIGDAMAEGIRADAAAFVAGSGADLPDVDRDLMQDPAVQAMMAASMTEAVRQGGRAFAEEMIMFAHPWGFELSSIRVPVLLWHGTEDRNVPVSHARHIAEQVPGARLRVLDGEGHMTLAMQHSPDFVVALLESTAD
jgi:pimeloyl-ACP methyl ester carboxylesterase